MLTKLQIASCLPFVAVFVAWLFAWEATAGWQEWCRRYFMAMGFLIYLRLLLAHLETPQ